MGNGYFSDNGIYYTHVNAGSGQHEERTVRPSQLFTALNPYGNTDPKALENSNNNVLILHVAKRIDPDKMPLSGRVRCSTPVLYVL